jgi:ribose 5-phosphate isomerase B
LPYFFSRIAFVNQSWLHFDALKVLDASLKKRKNTSEMNASNLTKKTIVIACDHAGLPLKKHLMAKFPQINWVDLGTNDETSVDYPDYADKVSKAISEKGTPAPGSADFTPLGVLICGSGQGMAIKANRNPNIRAALCWTPEIAQLARAHNNANVLCLGARVMDHAVCEKIFETFISTPFEGGRHAGRVQKLSN